MLLLPVLFGCGGGPTDPSAVAGPEQGAPHTAPAEQESEPPEVESDDGGASDPGAAGPDAGLMPQSMAGDGGTTGPSAGDSGDLVHGPSDQAAALQSGAAHAVMADGRLVLFNPYRGLQVVGYGTAGTATVDAELPLFEHLARGYGLVDMYVVAGQAVILLGMPAVPDQETHAGRLLLVDVAAADVPRITAELPIAAPIDSLLVQDGPRLSVYVASGAAGTAESGESDTAKDYVSRIEVARGQLEQREQLGLSGRIENLWPAGSLLLVHRSESGTNAPTKLGFIDISASEHLLSLDAELSLPRLVGAVSMQGDILRLVTDNRRADYRGSNDVRTYDLRDLAHPVALDSCEISEDLVLGYSLFQAEQAFFAFDSFHIPYTVTKGVVLAADGGCRVQPGYSLPAVHSALADAGAGRMLGVGWVFREALVDPVPQLYLYDSDLRSSAPQRAAVQLPPWFGQRPPQLLVAVPLRATAGMLRDGLALLTQQVSSERGERGESGVRGYAFSGQELRALRLLPHWDVTQLFGIDSRLSAAVSDQMLSLIDISEPADLRLHSQALLAPNYSELFVFGSNPVRVQRLPGPGSDRVQVLATEASDLQFDRPLTELEVPGDAALYQVSDLLVSMEMLQAATPPASGPTAEPRIAFTVYDLSTPQQLRQVGAAVLAVGASPDGSVRQPQVLVGQNSLVVYRDYEDDAGGAVGEMHVLDLSAAQSPVLRSVFRSSDERLSQWIASGTRVYCELAARQGGENAAPLLRMLELAEPGQPRMSAAVPSPGSLLAVVDAQVFVHRIIEDGAATLLTGFAIDRAVAGDGIALINLRARRYLDMRLWALRSLGEGRWAVLHSPLGGQGAAAVSALSADLEPLGSYRLPELEPDAAPSDAFPRSMSALLRGRWIAAQVGGQVHILDLRVPEAPSVAAGPYPYPYPATAAPSPLVAVHDGWASAGGPFGLARYALPE